MPSGDYRRSAMPRSLSMARFIDHHVAPEMACLWLVEVLFCFAVIYALLAPERAGAGGELMAANHAALLALAIGLTSFALGLYRSDLGLQRRRLVINTAIGGVAAFPVVWLVSHATGIDAGSQEPLVVAEALGTWILSLIGTRLLLGWARQMKLFVRRVVIVGSGPE